jgi:hypothetical protein
VRVDVSPRKKNAKRPAWKVEVAYLKWLRGRACYMAKHGGCAGKPEAAHTPDPMSKGMGTKAADHNCIPLCSAHHKLHTDKGWSAIGLSKETARAVAKAYWRLWQGDKGELA